MTTTARAAQFAAHIAHNVTGTLSDPSITFDVRDDGMDEAYATYSRAEVDATLRVVVERHDDGTTTVGYFVAIIDRTEDHDVVLDQYAGDATDAASLLALAVAMVRRPNGMTAWFTLREVDVTAAPLTVARDFARIGRRTILDILAAFDPEPATV